jgi:uncharacterized RDD family membrane protein YckC
MTREERLEYCQVCQHQKISLSQGIICRLTNRIADFDDTCSTFEVDEDLKNSLEKKVIRIEDKTATQGTRFVNYLLDGIFTSLLYLIFVFVFTILLSILSPVAVTKIDDDFNFVYSLCFIIVQFLYYLLFETITGRTLAKYITKTKVVDSNGNKPKLNTILLRTLCRYIPFEPFSFLGSDNSGWHDKLSKTLVINI